MFSDEWIDVIENGNKKSFERELALSIDGLS